MGIAEQAIGGKEALDSDYSAASQLADPERILAITTNADEDTMFAITSTGQLIQTSCDINYPNIVQLYANMGGKLRWNYVTGPFH